MTAPSTAPSPQLRRAVLSSYFGSLIEYYDFTLYAAASAVVFSQVFFTDLDPLTGTIASLGTLATGYLARPLGGILFGHFGDRIGRKRMLVTSMILMGVSSTLIGLLPTSAQIGTWAPVLLVLLRVLQGVAVGGEWGGAVLMSAEHAVTRRGLWASFTNAGAPSGLVVATLMITLSAGAFGEQEFLAWAWRIPFLASVVLLVVGLVVRARVEETPVFAGSAPTDVAPLLEVLRDHRVRLLLAIGVAVGLFVAQTTLTTYVLTYAVQAGFPRQTVLNALTAASVVAVVGIVGFSALSDRYGRRPLVIAGAIGLAVWLFVLFPLIDTGSPALLTVAIVVGLGVVCACATGPLAAFFSELFPTRVRYTGASLAYQLAGVAGGAAPVAFAAIRAGGGSTLLLSTIVAAGCALTVGCVLLLDETTGTDLGAPADVTAAPARSRA
ncbi:MFS transporter [Pseudonocardia broussonetiae]|uniref:MFS transporter n=1 Tax=Pseudonocardia broussonetiae TaxID=2736640 RepID=A0A6M6JNL2_9PSEU|nr:MFS transporter [Pseudonocardia broussonetiae]QJY48029.1 MFS transporter [Pseudonocardia broussonetiae]